MLSTMQKFSASVCWAQLCYAFELNWWHLTLTLLYVCISFAINHKIISIYIYKFAKSRNGKKNVYDVKYITAYTN